MAAGATAPQSLPVPASCASSPLTIRNWPESRRVLSGAIRHGWSSCADVAVLYRPRQGWCPGQSDPHCAQDAQHLAGVGTAENQLAGIRGGRRNLELAAARNPASPPDLRHCAQLPAVFGIHPGGGRPEGHPVTFLHPCVVLPNGDDQAEHCPVQPIRTGHGLRCPVRGVHPPDTSPRLQARTGDGFPSGVLSGCIFSIPSRELQQWPAPQPLRPGAPVEARPWCSQNAFPTRDHHSRVQQLMPWPSERLLNP